MTHLRQLQWAAKEFERAAAGLVQAEIHLKTAAQAVGQDEAAPLLDMATSASEISGALRLTVSEIREHLLERTS